MRFRMVWHVLLGGSAIAAGFVSGYRVMSFGESWRFVGFFLFWTFVWLVAFLKYARREREKDLGLLLAYPILHLIVSWSSVGITGPQVESAKAKAEVLAFRVDAYRVIHGMHPESWDQLVGHDGIPIPETGVGWWGDQDFHYDSWEEDRYFISFPAFRGMRYELWEDGEWEYGD
ncbi:MAG: hypothetical protein ACPG31_11480 [Planctomycetota bacterium]